MIAVKKRKMSGAVKNILLPYNKKVWLLCGMALANALLQVVFALLSRNVVDSALAGGADLAVWGVLLVVVVAAMAVLYALQNWIAGSTTDRCVARLRYAILESTVYRNDTDLREYHSGQLLSRSMEDVHTVCDGYVTLLPSAVGQVARLVGSFVAVLVQPHQILLLSQAFLIPGRLTYCLYQQERSTILYFLLNILNIFLFSIVTKLLFFSSTLSLNIV